jgi:hypothetical protein
MIAKVPEMPASPSNPVLSTPSKHKRGGNMARRGSHRSKPMNSFFQEWLEKNSFETVNEASRERKIPQSTLDRLADPYVEHSSFVAILELAEKMGLDATEMMIGILNGRLEAPSGEKIAS